MMDTAGNKILSLISSSAKRAFASFNRSTEQPKIQAARLTCSDTSESCQHIEITDRNNSWSPDVTFRGFDTARFSFGNYDTYDIFTNTEYLSDIPDQNKAFTRTTTNTGNLIDVFLIYSYGAVYGDQLYTVEVDP